MSLGNSTNSEFNGGFWGYRLFNFGVGLHLIEGNPPERSKEIRPAADHFSFQCENIREVEAQLQTLNVKYISDEIEHEGFHISQVRRRVLILQLDYACWQLVSLLLFQLKSFSFMIPITTWSRYATVTALLFFICFCNISFFSLCICSSTPHWPSLILSLGKRIGLKGQVCGFRAVEDKTTRCLKIWSFKPHSCSHLDRLVTKDESSDEAPDFFIFFLFSKNGSKNNSDPASRWWWLGRR